jgi:hypothetical protein
MADPDKIFSDTGVATERDWLHIPFYLSEEARVGVQGSPSVWKGKRCEVPGVHRKSRNRINLAGCVSHNEVIPASQSHNFETRQQSQDFIAVRCRGNFRLATPGVDLDDEIVSTTLERRFGRIIPPVFEIKEEIPGKNEF